jgi:hypothetical protein
MSDIFISYAREDRARVASVARALEGRGWLVWWDPKISAGQAFDRVIEEALANARCVVVVWSHRSVDSTWVRAEANDGLRRQRLVPVAIDDVQPPLLFRQIQTVDLSQWTGDPSDESFRRFVGDLAEILGRSPAPTSGTGLRTDAPAVDLRAPRRRFSPSRAVKVAAVLAVALAVWLGYRVVAPRLPDAVAPESRTAGAPLAPMVSLPAAGAGARSSQPTSDTNSAGARRNPAPDVGVKRAPSTPPRDTAKESTPPEFIVAEIVYARGTQAQALRWRTQGAKVVTINGSAVELDGVMPVDPSVSTTYTLLALSDDGRTARRTLQVGSRQQIALRATARTLTGDDVQTLYKSRGLHDSRWNPAGNFDNKFRSMELNGAAVVVDHASGLMWHRSGSLSEMSDWDDARGYLDRLNEQRYAGFSDWRLPTLEELATIIEPVMRNDTLHIDPVFDSRQKWLWSSDNAGERYGNHAWGIDLEAAHANIHTPQIVRFGSVRPVRSDR